MRKARITKQAEQYLGEPYARMLIPNEGGGYTAEILEFPGCISQGRTADEAVNNLNDAAKSWLEASLEDGREIPSPASNYDHSGKVVLRMPRSLHRHAAQMAERNSTSLNQYVVSAVSEQVGANELYSRLVDSLQESVRGFVSIMVQQSFYKIYADHVTVTATAELPNIGVKIPSEAAKVFAGIVNQKQGLVATTAKV